MPIRVSLTARLNAFTLGALALVLAGFSATIFLAARAALSRQSDERLGAALSTLLASVEFDPLGFEWEPNRRMLAPGQEPEAGEVRWTVRDDRGALVDRSLNLAPPRLLDSVPIPDRATARSYRRIRLDGRAWRVVQRRLGAGQRRLDPDAPVKDDSGHIYPALTFTVALCLEPTDAAEGYLGRLLAGVSVAIWLAAAAVGRVFCRRALRPLSRMAEAARGMSAAETGVRLPHPGTGDELHDLADSFNGLLDRLHEAFARQARFTGDASHQLRTPLAAMLGQVEVALRRDRPAEEYRRTLGLVRDQAAHLGRIVEMLLFLARADAEAKLPDRQVVDLTTWTRGHIANWATHPRAPDLSLAGCDGPARARVHPPLLGQLLDNLLDNAFKYSEPGTPVLVRVSVGPDGSPLLTVSDRGPGIAPEDRPHVFDPFFRSPQARRLGRPGVGLGLTIAQRIASSFDGRLDALSPPGGGSEFTVSLPLAGCEGERASEIARKPESKLAGLSQMAITES